MREQSMTSVEPSPQIGCSSSQHTIEDMTAGCSGPTRYAATRMWLAVDRTDVLHSRVVRPSFCGAASSRRAGLNTTISRLRRRLPCDRNYSVPGPFSRFQHRSLSVPQLQGEARVLPFCSSHWNHKRPKNYFPPFTQDPCQHVKVVPILLGKLGVHWRATP